MSQEDGQLVSRPVHLHVAHILRPTTFSIFVMLMALCFSLAVASGRRATEPSAWEADLGAPAPFLAIAESRQGCQAPGPCGDLQVRSVSVLGLLVDVVVWYGAACLLALALADAPDRHALAPVETGRAQQT